MFDFNKLGDMAKIANEAKKQQARQEEMSRRQIDLLEKISGQLAQVVDLLKKGS